MKITIIDSYDSFTYNILSLIKQVDSSIEIQIIQHDEILKFQSQIKQSNGIIIAPGQGDPKEYINQHKELKYIYEQIPVFGICLGFQIIGLLYNSETQKLVNPRHGEQVELNIITKDQLFARINELLRVGLYHSHYVNKIGKSLQVLAKDKDGIIMAIKHSQFPIYGIQFHAESFLTLRGLDILQNFLILCYEHLAKNE